MPSVLVTGAGRGIGRAIALRLAQRGWQVHAGVRSQQDGEALRAASTGDIRPLLLDVTDAAAVGRLPAELGSSLDAVVNNAGIVVAGPIEALDLDELRRQFEVNVFGQAAVTQAVLPLLRSARGRVVFISSVSGRVSTPLLGVYASSKFAVEGLADALRVELRASDIPVVLIEPGSIDTDIWRSAEDMATEVEARLSGEHRVLYARQIASLRRLARMIQGRTSSPEKVADAVERALTQIRPRARYVVGPDARLQLTLAGLLPTRAWDGLLALVSGAR